MGVKNDFTGIKRMKDILEVIQPEAKTGPQIYHSVKHSQFAIYKSIKFLRKHGLLDYATVENDKGMLVVSYRANKKGSELVQAITQLEQLLK